MYTEQEWKEQLIRRMRIDPYVHICVSLAKPHVEMRGVKVKLVGMYRHIFQIEAQRDGKLERISLQYGDLVAGIVQIEEFN